MPGRSSQTQETYVYCHLCSTINPQTYYLPVKLGYSLYFMKPAFLFFICFKIAVYLE